MLGVTSRTLRNWDYKGIIKVTRTATGYRTIPLSEIHRIQNRLSNDRITLVYCRVSTRKQKDDLERQLGRVLSVCAKNGWKVEIYKDIGSGLNENRKEFQKLIERVSFGDVARIVVEYRDRLSRFGFKTLSDFCLKFNTEVISLNDDLNRTFEQELSEDLISIITCYLARFYGRRGGKK